MVRRLWKRVWIRWYIALSAIRSRGIFGGCCLRLIWWVFLLLWNRKEKVRVGFKG